MPFDYIEQYEIPINDEDANKKICELNTRKVVLLIQDMQNCFVDSYNNNSLINQVIDNISKLKMVCKKLKVPIVYTIQPRRQGYEDREFLNRLESRNLRIIDREFSVINKLQPEIGDVVIYKSKYSALNNEELLESMKFDRKTILIITGIYGHAGCIATASDAFLNGIHPILIADCIADYSEEHHICTINFVKETYGEVAYLDNIISSLIQGDKEY